MKDKLLLIILWLFVIAFIALIVYVYAAYGGRPASEVPTWALMFFLRRR